MISKNVSFPNKSKPIIRILDIAFTSIFTKFIIFPSDQYPFIRPSASTRSAIVSETKATTSHRPTA